MILKHIEVNKGKPVCYSDGFKSVENFAATFDGVHHGRCVKHLCNSMRVHLRKLSKKNTDSIPVKVGFHDKQVYRCAKAIGLKNFKIVMNALKKTSYHAHQYLDEKDHQLWSLNAMAKINVPTYGHCTSNVVEGTNSTVLPERKLHPYQQCDALVCRVQRQIGLVQKRVSKDLVEGKMLVSFARTKLNEEIKTTRDPARNYRVTHIHNKTYWVQDLLSRHRIRRKVCVDPGRLSCEQCSMWGVYRICCRHMFCVIAKHFPTLLQSEQGKSIFRNRFFHPAYLTDKYDNLFDDAIIHVPTMHYGPDTVDISVDEDHVIESVSMLPPENWTREKYLQNKKRGRPQSSTRIRSAGGTCADGGRVPRKRKAPEHKYGTRNNIGEALTVLDSFMQDDDFF